MTLQTFMTSRGLWLALTIIFFLNEKQRLNLVDFALVMLLYGVIQFIDGNILVPLLFSEAVNLHPVAIITAILLFGGLWGLWGVFFAIPLATLIKAVINAWPREGSYRANPPAPPEA